MYFKCPNTNCHFNISCRKVDENDNFYCLSTQCHINCFTNTPKPLNEHLKHLIRKLNLDIAIANIDIQNLISTACGCYVPLKRIKGNIDHIQNEKNITQFKYTILKSFLI